MSLFKSQTGKFKDITCPFLSNCTLGNCLYNHSAPKRTATSSDANAVPAKRVKPVSPPSNDPIKNSSSRPDNDIPLATPEKVTNPPAPHQQRQQFVHVLRDKLREKGLDARTASERATEIERDVADRTTKFTYSMGIRSAVREILSGQLLEDRSDQQDEQQLLNSELINLLVPKPELVKRRYILTPPEPQKLESTATLECARCSSKFPIFHPQTTTTQCRFHLLKREYDPKAKRRSTLFPCCNQSLEESNGCESRNFHVYKLEEPSYMQGVLPFRKAPFRTRSGGVGLFACGIDCEMAWTTQGFELVRITVVDYESRSRKYDRLVWPKGTILDLNTRFSGISDMNAGIIGENNQLELPVDLEMMYEQLFDLITSNTILVGHGLENDMNVLRLAHDRIVDTAILLPRNKIRTYALKELAWEFLGRTIQAGEHDSMEDALAAIDIIQADIKQRCTRKVVRSFKK